MNGCHGFTLSSELTATWCNFGCVFIAMAMTSFIKISVALKFRATDWTKLCLESKQEDKDCTGWTGLILYFFNLWIDRAGHATSSTANCPTAPPKPVQC